MPKGVLIPIIDFVFFFYDPYLVIVQDCIKARLNLGYGRVEISSLFRKYRSNIIYARRTEHNYIAMFPFLL